MHCLQIITFVHNFAFSIFLFIHCLALFISHYFCGRALYTVCWWRFLSSVLSELTHLTPGNLPNSGWQSSILNTWYFCVLQDFWQMVIHHIVTVMLTTFSYTAGFFRIGSVIILLHDLADIFLEVSFVLKCRLMLEMPFFDWLRHLLCILF